MRVLAQTSCHRTTFVVVGFVIVAAMSISTATPARSECSKCDRVADVLKQNVVRITSTDGERGFGFIIGEASDAGKLVVITADHVVREPGNPVRDAEERVGLEVHFYNQETRTPELQRQHIPKSEGDLGVLVVEDPGGIDWKPAVLDARDYRRNTPASFLGHDGVWRTMPTEGTREPVPGLNQFVVVSSNIKVGCSGAPLFSDQGLIGLLVNDHSNTTHALSATHINLTLQSPAYQGILRSNSGMQQYRAKRPIDRRTKTALALSGGGILLGGMVGGVISGAAYGNLAGLPGDSAMAMGAIPLVGPIAVWDSFWQWSVDDTASKNVDSMVGLAMALTAVEAAGVTLLIIGLAAKPTDAVTSRHPRSPLYGHAVLIVPSLTPTSGSITLTGRF